MSKYDKVRDECGVFGIYAERDGVDVVGLTYLGLYALQHRGQESAGIAISNGKEMTIHKGMGLASQVFDDSSLSSLQGFKGRIAIGHVRYSTTGSSIISNAQPLMVRCSKGTIALAHNGTLVNFQELSQELERNGSIFQSTVDTEVIVNLIARFASLTLEDSIVEAAKLLKGAYSLVIMDKGRLIGVRDPLGMRPMCLGRLPFGYVIASESCGLSAVGAEFLRDVAPGEMVVINEKGLRSRQIIPSSRRALCAFEFVYIARPDSIIEGKCVHLVRKEFGRQLARESHIDADLVISAPDSGTSAALGFAEESGIPFDLGLIKNRYVGRTFIQPSQEMRVRGVSIKLNPVEAVLRGKRVIIIDDSIVRGTTSGKMVKMLRDAGAREVHMCIASPPFTYPCYYGVDTPTREELIASSHSLEEVKETIGADTLSYLSIEGLKKSLGDIGGGLCDACFTGRYPV